MNKKEVKVPAEVYSRVAGYYRPVKQWNRGKQEEFRDRKEYRIQVSEKIPAYEYQGNL
jgi:anaerobic ribonucleoside-triphosphate reductase